MQANLCKRDGNEDNSDGGVMSLPEDIVLEVLLRLPAKALCQFPCVCKAWHAIISDPTFVATQRSRATGPFIIAMFGSAPVHELRLLDKGGNVLMVFDVRGSATALLAQTRLDLIFVDRAKLGAMAIDPASGRDFIVIGKKDALPPWWAPMLTSTAMMGDYSFGRVIATGDYKVLRLITSSANQRCEVTTIMDGGAKPTWRRRKWGPFHDTIFSSEDKATVNGVLYFMPYKTDPTSFQSRKHIAAFDLEGEKWKQKMIKCPPLVHKEEDAWHIALTELKGTLCVVQNIWHLSSWGDHYVNIWLLMNPNKSTWVKEYRIQMPERFLLSTTPLDVLGDGTTLLLLNASWKARNVFRYILQLYNCSTKDFTDFMVMAPGFNDTMTFYPGSILF